VLLVRSSSSSSSSSPCSPSSSTTFGEPEKDASRLLAVTKRAHANRMARNVKKKTTAHPMNWAPRSLALPPKSTP
jgi:hypothetical protein